MSKFEVVSRFLKPESEYTPPLPKRATANAAGYDFVVAEDIIVPSYRKKMAHWEDLLTQWMWAGTDLYNVPQTLQSMASLVKQCPTQPTLVPTGIKCQLEPAQYLELSVRSSLPLKSWLVLANGVGIIDADYYNNESNEGEIFFQLINLSPLDIELHKGDRIGQGIIKNYKTVDGDEYGKGEKRIGGFGSTNQSNTIVNKPKYIYKPTYCTSDNTPTITCTGSQIVTDLDYVTVDVDSITVTNVTDKDPYIYAKAMPLHPTMEIEYVPKGD